MDWTSIIVALISGFVSSFSAILVFIANEKNRKQKLEESHRTQLKETEDSIKKALEDSKKEYMAKIGTVTSRLDSLEGSFSDLQTIYQQNTAVVTLQISQLEKKQDKHNSIIERTYIAEKDIEVLKQRETVSERRLLTLENKCEKE